jgi:hypothetical protein
LNNEILCKKTRHGEAGHGWAKLGEVRQGEARQGFLLIKLFEKVADFFPTPPF